MTPGNEAMPSCTISIGGSDCACVYVREKTNHKEEKNVATKTSIAKVAEKLLIITELTTIDRRETDRCSYKKSEPMLGRNKK